MLDFSKKEAEFSMFFFSCSDVLVRDTLYANTVKLLAAKIYNFPLCFRCAQLLIHVSPVNDKLVGENTVCIS